MFGSAWKHASSICVESVNYYAGSCRQWHITQNTRLIVYSNSVTTLDYCKSTDRLYIVYTASFSTCPRRRWQTGSGVWCTHRCSRSSTAQTPSLVADSQSYTVQTLYTDVRCTTWPSLPQPTMWTLLWRSSSFWCSTWFRYTYRTRTRPSDKSFSVAGPRSWNSLPTNIRTANTRTTFCNHLKTFLFKISYGSD